MRRVLQPRQFRRARRGWVLGMLPALLWGASASAAKVSTTRAVAKPAASAATTAGCRDGWHRVGTVKDPALRRTWAVVASCLHPAWPAHLELAGQWQVLPGWVPAGSRVVLRSPSTVTAMRLDGTTVTPGRVGQAVTVRLIDGVRVRATLITPESAEIATVAHWRQP